MGKRCCANCIYLDRDNKIIAQKGTHYIYGCNKIRGLCIKNWVHNDCELENIVCEDFKEKGFETGGIND